MVACHLVYIAGSRGDDVSNVLTITCKRPILTIADYPDAAEKGILVNLYVEMNKLRFEINEKGFREAGPEINSILLKVSRIVNPLGN